MKNAQDQDTPVNIRPMVHEITCAFDGKDSRLSMVLGQTNANALKVELVMQALAPGRNSALCARRSTPQERTARAKSFEAIQEEK